MRENIVTKIVDQVLANNVPDKEDLTAHLIALRSESKLQTSGLEGREIHMISSWDEFVTGSDKVWHVNGAVEIVSKWCTYLSFSLRRQEEEKIKALTNLLIAGTVSADDHYLTSSDDMDQVTGDRGRITLTSWKPEFWILKREDGRYEHKLATSIEKIKPVTVGFTAPSGKLIFSDIIRHDDFPKLSEPSTEEKYDNLSLNTVTGRQALSEYYAREHNFGYFQTANTYVGVFQKGDDIIVTERWHDGDDVEIERWDFAGEFSCDIWRVTAIDRAQFAKITGKEDTSSLEAYLSSGTSYSKNYAMVEVPAGARIIMTSGDHFDEDMDKASLGIPDHVFVWGHFKILVD